MALAADAVDSVDSDVWGVDYACVKDIKLGRHTN